MSKNYDSLIKGGTLATHEGAEPVDIAIKDGQFAALNRFSDSEAGELADEVIDATGLTILPGVIDTQVHFREPGLGAKEDLESGSRAAVMGGVTAVFEMPNTKPPTTTAEAVAEKVALGQDRMHCDFAFYVGGTPDNAETLPDLEKLPGVCGVKVFMGSSTGNLLVADDDGVGRILKAIK
ncbi:MAG: amidohydrolase family protein, partial [Pseudomonadota bacterium]|nr:amidohydrolase family protein [Pseudomonadota bacterium]